MPHHSLVSVLGHPELARNLDEIEWNQIIQAARQTELLGQLSAAIQETMAPEDIHWRLKRAFDLELLTAQRRSEAAIWEIRNIRHLIPKDIAIVVLKGCAYVLANDRNASGRQFSDVDILVAEEHLGIVESALISGGWKPSQVSAYDQKYYRNWMHEVPPMEHVRRHTTVDLHHAIIPPISRFAFDPKRLNESAIEMMPGIFILSPADRVIHSAIHAFQEGLATKALRDLYDIACLMRQHFSEQQAYMRLIIRAEELGLKPILLAGLEASTLVFDTTSPHSETPGLRGKWLASAALNAIKPQTSRGEIMEKLLLAHSHWMKMPWSILVPHLIHKSWLRLVNKHNSQ